MLVERVVCGIENLEAECSVRLPVVGFQLGDELEDLRPFREDDLIGASQTDPFWIRRCARKCETKRG